MTNALEDLTSQGVSIWLDDLSRGRILDGSLSLLIKEKCVTGVTTNPTIFAAALAQGDQYRELFANYPKSHLRVEEAIFEATTSDVRDACDIFRKVFDTSQGEDGRVSIEVEPGLAMDPVGTLEQAKKLHAKVNRPNVMIKIPATLPGLKAITDTLAEGISVNVTLIFSIERYRQVISAYKAGLNAALARGKDLRDIRSVASFFVSRVDTEVDKQLMAVGSNEALALKSTAAIANARLAYEVFQEEFSGQEWEKLAASGANLQRPLMASTGVKDPKLPDTLYVTELVGPNLVNTMPEKTLEAVFEHGKIAGNTIQSNLDDARETFAKLESIGISMKDVVLKLEQEGLEKFIVSWNELLETASKLLGELE